MALAPVFIVLAAALAAAPPAGAPRADAPTREVRNQVRALLGAIHAPVSPDTFRALGPGAEEALAEFAREANGPPGRRARALAALAELGSPRAEAVHREVAASSTAPRSVRRTAVRGLGRLAGEARAGEELYPFLERDRDPTVRAAAAEALAANAPADSCATIRRKARAEAGGPSRYGRALVICDRAAASGAQGR